MSNVVTHPAWQPMAEAPTTEFTFEGFTRLIGINIIKGKFDFAQAEATRMDVPIKKITRSQSNSARKEYKTSQREFKRLKEAWDAARKSGGDMAVYINEPDKFSTSFTLVARRRTRKLNGSIRYHVQRLGGHISASRGLSVHSLGPLHDPDINTLGRKINAWASPGQKRATRFHRYAQPYCKLTAQSLPVLGVL